ncbi:WD40 repeat protein [Streptomyces sp. V4I8]|uniref:WD40 repeat domain-containing protein n=1 Tax=Streptomyces sp. V4I8 TaxID=3156469 RepID=UPI00351692D8
MRQGREDADLGALRDLEPEPPQPGSDSVTCQAVVEPASGKLLIATGHRDGWVRVWDAETGAKDLEFSTGLSSVEAVTGFTAPDGRTLLAVGGQLSERGEYDGRIRLWDLSTGTEVAALSGHSGGVAQLTTLTRADGTLVLVSGGSQDATVSFWDIDTGELTAQVELGHGLVSGLLPLRSADGRDFLVVRVHPHLHSGVHPHVQSSRRVVETFEARGDHPSVRQRPSRRVRRVTASYDPGSGGMDGLT